MRHCCGHTAGAVPARTPPVVRAALAISALALLVASVWGVTPSRPAAAQGAGFSTPTLAADDDVTFHGAGWGHGVGLSHQALPARVVAGQTARDILGFYYPGTVLTGGWKMDNLRVNLATAHSSRFRPRGPFELAVDGVSVHDSPDSELITVSRDGAGWDVTDGDGDSLCTGQACDGNVLSIRTADGVAVESSATGHSYSHGRITLSKVPGTDWYRIVLTHLDVELYLRGVAEVPPDWPVEALRAQAIASRSYALHVARENRGSDTWTAPFDLFATTMSQVYIGNTRELAPNNGPWLQAIADTEGQVQAFNGEPALALFSTSGGGYTENSGYVFNEQHPYLVAAPDPFVAGDPYTPWTRSYSVSALSRWLARAPDTKVGTLRHIEVSGHIGGSGRIDRATVRLTGSAGTRSVSGTRFVFVVNSGAESEGWGPHPNAEGRGGHLLSTKFTVGRSDGLPPEITSVAAPSVIPLIDPPGEPRGLSLEPGLGQIEATWQPPAADGGSPITGYLITWISTTGASGTIPTTETSRTLRNLSPEATYTVSVAASNAGGTSRSVTAEASPIGVPATPTDVTVQRGDGRLEVSWSPPAGNGGAQVRSYAVHWTGPDGVTQFTAVQGTRHIIEGLTNGATYTVTVTAVNEVGSSSRSSPAEGRPATNPGAPGSVTARRGPGIVEVAWAPPAGDGGVPITGYAIDWVSSTGASGTVDTTGTPYTMRNLLNGATYTVTVRALNEAGTSLASESASATPAAAPDSPSAVTADRGDGRVGVSWQPPAGDGGKPVLGYTVSWSTSDGGAGSAETTATNHTIEGLTNGVTYDITVVAVNEIGTSAASPPAEATPAHIPGAPVAVRAGREDSRLHVSWDPPASDGGLQVTGYSVLWVSPDGVVDSAETTATSHTIGGLTNGVTYGITVAAINEVGSSVTADPVRATPARAPDAPARAEIAMGHESLLVSWAPPLNDGGLPVRFYTLTWTAPDGAAASIDTTHTSHAIEDLIGGAAYRIDISAGNEVGVSPVPLSAQATPQHAPTIATAQALAPPGPQATADPPMPEQVTEAPAAAQPAVDTPAVAPNTEQVTARSWQDSVTDDTAVVVLAAVGLVLIAALLVVTRRRSYEPDESVADVADIW